MRTGRLTSGSERAARARTEAQLVRRCLEGDTGAIEELVSHYYPSLVQFIGRYTGLHHSAEDLAQDVLLKVLRSLDSFDERASLRTWIFAVAVNACRDEIRRIQRRREVLVPAVPERVPTGGGPSDDDEQGPQAVLESNLRSEEIRSAVEALPEQQREAVILRFYHGLSLAEIAQACGCSVGTVGSRLHYAVKALRRKLARDDRDATDARQGRDRNTTGPR